MITDKYAKVKKRFKKYCKAVVKNAKPIVIARKNGENAVLLSLALYDNMQENLYIRSNPVEYAKLLKSIA